MDSSSASTGDVIEIKGKDCRRTVAKCLLLYPSDEGKEIIRIDGLVRDNAGVPNHWMFNMGVVVAFMGALAYVVRVACRKHHEYYKISQSMHVVGYASE